MNKYGILTFSFLIATSLSNVWAAPTVSPQSGNPAGMGDEPPPPPPPPPPPSEPQAVNKAQKIYDAANKVVSDHNAFVEAEYEALNDPQNSQKKATMDAAATKLGQSIATVIRLANSLKKDLEKIGPAEIKQMTQEISRTKKVPPQTQDKWIQELKEKLKQRKGEGEEEEGSPTEPIAE